MIRCWAIDELTSGDDHHGWRFVDGPRPGARDDRGGLTSRLRDIARTVGITKRTTAQIVNDLVDAGYLTKFRNGRRNHYEVHEELPLRHPRHRHHTVGELIRFLETAELAALAA